MDEDPYMDWESFLEGEAYMDEEGGVAWIPSEEDEEYDQLAIPDFAPHWHEEHLEGHHVTSKWLNGFTTIRSIKRAIFTGAGEEGLKRFCDLDVDFLFFDKKLSILITRRDGVVQVR